MTRATAGGTSPSHRAPPRQAPSGRASTCSRRATPRRPSRRRSSSSSSGWPSASGSTASPNWPDPDPDGSFPLPPSINPKDAANLAAGRACQQYLPSSGHIDVHACLLTPRRARARRHAGSAADGAAACRPATSAARGKRPLAIAVTGVALAAAAGFAARGLWPGGTHPPVASAVTVSTALVVRTDLSARAAGGRHPRLPGFLHRRQRVGRRDHHLAARRQETSCAAGSRCSPSTASR